MISPIGVYQVVHQVFRVAWEFRE